MNFMAGGIFCVKSFLLRRHAAAPCRSRHFEGSEAESRNLLFPKVSYRVETQRLHGVQESIGEKFPVDMKRSGFKPDRKPFAKSFLLR